MEFSELRSYKKLKEKDSILFSQVELVYDSVKEILNNIAGKFNNYTMHDVGHSIRVANYMEQLAFGIDENCTNRIDQFNAAEFAIILLISLLHDIGMYFNDEDIVAIKNDNFNHTKSLTYNGVLKVKNNNSDEAIKEIVRATHATRISDILNKELSCGSSIASFLKIDNKYSYSSDIELICKAHGEDYEFIKNELRDEITLGKYTYNQQYFAVLLRIADYLDLDRQRTPILWYSIMNIDGYSKLEWENHFQITNEIKLKPYYDGKMKIYFDGKSSNAKIHRRYLRYIDDVKNELENADALLNCQYATEKYLLNVSTKIDDLVKTEGFRYSDLRLNLDYAAITELLMGKNIYGDSRLGLRELIQNSIDACKIMNEINFDEDYDIPSITIAISKEKKYVKIKDTGIGMTLDVIKNHFLNVGKSYYKSDDYIYQNYKYKPIGQFGIGFLACFLLSDNVIVRTKHYKNNEVLKIELEKNSEYVVTKTEEPSPFYGTEIQLNYDDFFSVFKSVDDLEQFVGEHFYSNVPIRIKDDDNNRKILINNKIEKMIEDLSSKKPNIRKINCENYSDKINGQIIIKKVLEQPIKLHPILIDKYLFDIKLNKFIKIDRLENGYYRYIKYGQITESDYENIKQKENSDERIAKSILSLSSKQKKSFYLFIKSSELTPFSRRYSRFD